MAIITNIDGIPLYSTQQEALNYAQERGLEGFHTHTFQGQVGYMGGKDHNNAVTGVGIPLSNENIKISKKLYSRSDVNNSIDLSFSELLSSNNESINEKVKKFFREYDNLFYDIPKNGNESHTTLFQQSKDYINDFFDPKDDQIDALLERIEALEDELLSSALNTDQEHPVYNDGSFIKTESNPTVYFMYKGRACPVGGDGTPSAYDILARKYYPYVMADNYDGDKFDPVVIVDSYSALPPRGPILKNGEDINNIDELIQVYLS